MIDDMLHQDWSTLHSHSIDLKFRHAHVPHRPLASPGRYQKGSFYPDGRLATLQSLIEHYRLTDQGNAT
jgi:hypothetical protein